MSAQAMLQATNRPPLTPDEILRYRSIVKSAIVLIVLWRLGRQSGAVEIARILEINRETVAGYLESLAMIGLVTRIDIRGGYRLTDDGRQLVMQVPGGYILDEALQAQAAAQIIDYRMSEFPTLESGKPERMSEKPTLSVGNSDIQQGSIRLMIDESSSCSSSAGSEKFPTLETILNGMSAMRGMRVQGKYDDRMPWESLGVSEISEKTPAKLALAWVVKAYGDRQRLNNPVGMVLSRLKAFTPRSLPANWQERLPAEYLQALGIATQPPLPPAEPVESLTENQPGTTDPFPEAPDTTLTPSEDPPDEPETPTRPEKPNAFRLYEENIGPLTPMLADALRDAETSYPEGWIEDAIAIAVKNNRRSWAYTEGVLKRWQENGRGYTPRQTAPTGARPKPNSKRSQADVDTMLADWLAGDAQDGYQT